MSDPGSSAAPPTGPSDIECRQIAELLADYLDGSLPRRMIELIDWHIEGCGPCVAFINTYRGTVKAARELRNVDVPPELKKRLLKVMRARDSEQPPA